MRWYPPSHRKLGPLSSAGFLDLHPIGFRLVVSAAHQKQAGQGQLLSCRCAYPLLRVWNLPHWIIPLCLVPGILSDDLSIALNYPLRKFNLPSPSRHIPFRTPSNTHHSKMMPTSCKVEYIFTRASTALSRYLCSVLSLRGSSSTRTF